MGRKKKTGERKKKNVKRGKATKDTSKGKKRRKKRKPKFDPYKWNDKKKEKWLDAYKNSGSIVGACEAVGGSRKQLYRILDENEDVYDEEFAEAKEFIDEYTDDVVESRMYKLTETSVAAIKFWLCNRRKKRWQDIYNIKHDGNIGLTLKDVMNTIRGKGKKKR